MKSPITNMQFFTREDGSQYAQVDYDDGTVEITERDTWIANSWSDFWLYGSMRAAAAAKVREHVTGNN
jgi:hypothetical protein